MNKITTEGKNLLTRIDKNKLVFTRAMFDTGQSLSIIGSVTEDNLFTLQLRIDNLNLSQSINYSQIYVYAKIDGDSSDVMYAYVTKSGFIPANTDIPEFVEDIDLCFVFSDIDSITIDNISNVYALNKDLLKKPDLFVGIHKPTIINSPYLWYQTFGDDIGFAGSDYEPETEPNEEYFDKEVILELTDEEMPLNVLIDGELSGVQNVDGDTSISPLEFIIEV